jgi:hypothetical protein
MNETLKLFYNDTLEDENEIFNRAVSLYLTRRILGDFPSKEELNNDKDEIIIFFKNIYMKILLTCMKIKPDINLKEEYDMKNINFNFKVSFIL